MSDNVKVEQRDRQAYHRLAAIENSNVPFWASTEGAWLLSGDADNTPQIQAFARHRLTALAWRQPMSNDEDFEDAMALYEATANAGSRHHLATQQPVADMPTREADLQLAVDYAVAELGRNEPGDSRGVSDEFIALASIASNLTNQKCRDILRARIDALLAQR